MVFQRDNGITVAGNISKREKQNDTKNNDTEHLDPTVLITKSEMQCLPDFVFRPIASGSFSAILCVCVSAEQGSSIS